MKSLLNDVTFGLRTLIKNPGFTIVAVLSLGLGIGAVTSVYSMISAVLLTPLPFDEADRLYSLYTISERDRELRDSCSYPEYMEWQKQSKSFESLAAYSNGSYN